MSRILGALALAVTFLISIPATALGNEPDPALDSIILVAKPELGEFYAQTVLLVRPLPGGGHMGIILNRPTPVTLGKLFPEHAPSQKVQDPVHLGGPVMTNALFAAVKTDKDPGGKSIEIADGLFFITDVKTVDQIIEHNAANARFFAGMVAWRPGELDHELSNGFWSILPPDINHVFDKKPADMWKKLTPVAVPKGGTAI